MAKVDEILAKALKSAQTKFGKDNTYVAADHDSAIPVIRCPIAWGYGMGGWDGMPISGNLGCDGLPGHWKSTLGIAHAMWVLMEDGIVVRTDNEERTNPDLVRSVLCGLSWEQRGRLIHEEVSSVEGWQDRVTHWSEQAKSIRDYAPEDRAPIFQIVDSLTGRGTRGEEAAVKTKGHAEERGYSGSASSIAKFYKSMSYRSSMYALFHVQHAKVNMDQYATKNEKLVANGGIGPRFNCRYHFRVVKQETIDCNEFFGRELIVRCIRSGLGEGDREIAVRFLWRYEWRHMPVYEAVAGDAPGEVKYTTFESDRVFNEPQEAVAWWDAVNPHMPRSLAEKLAEDLHIFEWKEWFSESRRAALEVDEKSKLLGEAAKQDEEKSTAATKKERKRLDKALEDLAKELQKMDENKPQGDLVVPETELKKVQISWFDWDYSLAWILGNILDEGYAKDVEELQSEEYGLPGISRSGCNKRYMKCPYVFGDKDPHSYTEVGKAIQANPEALNRVKKLLRIEHRMHFREVPIRSGTDGGKQSKKKK